MNKVAVIVSLALPLSGCAVGPDYHAPAPAALAVPTNYAPSVTHSAPSGDAVAVADLATWWLQFDDPLLTDLIARATASNLQIAQSVARLAQAREALVQARGALLPTLMGSAGSTRNFTAGDYVSGSTRLSLSADASWQADIFGGLGRGVEAARADEATARFDLEGVRTSIAGEVATNYIDVRLAQARLDIARSTLRTQEDNFEIAGWRVQAGLVSSLDAEQARAQRAQTAACS